MLYYLNCHVEIQNMISNIKIKCHRWGLTPEETFREIIGCKASVSCGLN